MAKILFIGETWIKHIIHQKGFDTFTSTHYEFGAQELFDAMSLENEITHIPAHDVANKFPRNLEELKQYDVVFISDVGSNTLLLSDAVFVRGERETNKCSLIKEYVLDGGSFVMIGGYMSFSGINGVAKYGKTDIQDILPVECLEVDDRVEAPQGITPNVVLQNHEILDGLPQEWPTFFGYNETKLGNDSTLISSFGNHPFISFKNFGKGKSLVFTSDCSPHWGSNDFLEWEGYSKLWNNIVRFMSK